MSRPRTFTAHLCDPARHTPGDAAILDAIQVHLRESGEIPDCTRSQARRWALNHFISVDSPVFRHLPAWWQIYVRHDMQELGVGDLMEEESAGGIETEAEKHGTPG